MVVVAVTVVVINVVMVFHWPKSVGFGSVWGKNRGFGRLRFRFSASAVNSRRRSSKPI